MDFENKYEWVSTSENALMSDRKTLDMLEHELSEIKSNLEVLEEKRLRLANLAKLY